MSSEDNQNIPFQPVTTSQFLSFDFEEPISDSNSVGYHDLSEMFRVAREKSESEGRMIEAYAFALLSIICRFHSKPEDRGEPYGPMFVSGDGRRSLIPADFRGEQSVVFGEIAARTQNPALRARLADVAWLNRRSDAVSKTNAIAGLNDSVALVLDQRAYFDGGKEENHTWMGVKYLQRALSIGSTRGTDPSLQTQTNALLVQMRTIGLGEKIPSIFGRAAKLDLSYGVSDVNLVASDAVDYAEFNEANKDLDGAGRNWLIAAQAYEIARDQKRQADCLIRAAECHVAEAVAMAGSAMNATSSLMRAIEQYREVQRQYRPAGRLEELKALLVAKQAELRDEMSTFEESADITDEVNKAITAYSGKALSDCLLGLAHIGRPKGIEAYRAEIRQSAEEFSFASVIDTTVHDDEGKIVTRIPALDLSGNISDEDVRARCAQVMGFEHQAGVQGAIRPVLHTMRSEHVLSEELFYLIAKMSPFVPPGHEGVFSIGLSRFFSGANIEACCLLIPQLENALRYVLKQTGTDVTKITNASTQEDVMLSVLLDRFRDQLDKIFGEAMMFQIEMIFHSRQGFNLRNSLAHGTVKDHEFWSATHIFACWLIYKLMMAPLISRWDDVKAMLERERFS
ncbi:DUF4209 domain-containing protein [Methylobacterium sp. 37f]|uniref:DUF4209 domain-containing protein n=1 Tax=Methylobacterium sp. 37f TaxID=2817058 RepID=UPI001FFDBA1C|nr:DUF4209 domain-containing protein [Methylobacterium sp. 37f]MCK2054761.1 DUF4209 domain-containing protein [Methylobacterium sp. 37f]